MLRSIQKEPQSKPASAVQDLIDPAQNSATAITVAATAFGLLAVFLVNLISGAVPMRLLDQQWHLRVIRQAQVERASQWRSNQRQFIALQQAIVQATTLNDLLARMQALDGPVFAVQDQALPLERVRQQLLQGVYQGRQWLLSRKRMPSSETGQSLHERQRASEQQVKRMHESRKRALQEQRERERKHKLNLSRSGASSANGSEGLWLGVRAFADQPRLGRR